MDRRYSPAPSFFLLSLGPNWTKRPHMERIEYEIELERIDGPAHHTSASLPSLTKGQRLKVPVDGRLVYAEVIEVTKLTTDEPVKWKLLARELELPQQEGSIPINQLNASNDD
jgi:hypothetical protein